MTNADAEVEFECCGCSRPTYEKSLFELKDLPWRRFCKKYE
jgi:hypothetical protein